MGGLFYPNVTPVVLIGTKTGTTRTPVTLTNTYTSNYYVLPVSGHAVLTFDVHYTTGASETGTSVNIKVLDSTDKTNFYSLTNESATGGTSTLTDRVFTRAGGAGATSYDYSYRMDITYKYLKIQVAESGVSTNYGTVFIEGVLGGN